MTESTAPSGATPSEPDPASGATPGGQETGTGATPAGQGSTEGATPDTTLGDGGREALDKERAARRDAARQLAEARQRIAQLEDAGKTETERTQARLQRAQVELEQSNRRIEELQQQATDREVRELKREVAAEKGLPPQVAERLQGTDLRSLRADAEKFREAINAGVPAGNLGLGHGGSTPGRGGRDMNALIREAAGRS